MSVALSQSAVLLVWSVNGGGIGRRRGDADSGGGGGHSKRQHCYQPTTNCRSDSIATGRYQSVPVLLSRCHRWQSDTDKVTNGEISHLTTRVVWVGVTFPPKSVGQPCHPSRLSDTAGVGDFQ